MPWALLVQVEWLSFVGTPPYENMFDLPAILSYPAPRAITGGKCFDVHEQMVVPRQ